VMGDCSPGTGGSSQEGEGNGRWQWLPAISGLSCSEATGGQLLQPGWPFEVGPEEGCACYVGRSIEGWRCDTDATSD